MVYVLYATYMNQKKEIAQWLNDRILARQAFYQEDAVREISEIFGKEFTYIDAESGNPRILTGILERFRKLKDKKIKWDNVEKSWYVNFEPGEDIRLLEFEPPEFNPNSITFEPPELDTQWLNKKRS